MTTRGILRTVLAVLLTTGGFLAIGAAPAFACSCRAGVPVEESLAESDGAFVGVFTGRDDPLGHGDIVSSGRRVLNHFQVERSVKGDIGGRVDVTAAASGASCGLELQVGQRTGLLLRRDAGGGWTSGLCSQVEPQALLAFAPAAAPGSDAPESDAVGSDAASADAAGAGGADWGLILLVGLLVLAVAGAVVLEVVHRRAP